MGTDELVEALDQVRNGTPPFSPGLAAKLLDEFVRVKHSKGPISSKDSGEPVEVPSRGMLNSRQIEVLRLVADGLTYKEVGARLFLSPRTIKYHMAEIMDRLHLENRAQVLTLAGRMGWAADKPEK